LLILSFHGFSPQPLFDNLVRYLVWLPLLILGFGIATYLSAKLGWANAHGEKDGLIISGLYRWSRNPIYVASIVGIIGWSLFVNSCYVSTILVLWAFMYFLAPFVEAPWLERSYGEDFLA
jgi:protein-S-isoprenylcysteine O-methyltransferase Ste14